MRKLIFIGLSFFLFISLILNNGIYSATTGKIQGTITDAQSKEGLPGVNITLEGTTMGAATDDKGFFFIINIPPGTYSLKASIVGYAVETKSDVRVYVDRTTTTDFQLKTQAIAGQEVTVTAARAPVPLDVSQTESYVSGEDVSESPVARFDQLMGYQAGVTFAETWGNAPGRGFSVRGGEVIETDVQIDGVSMMNKQVQQVQIPISRNLIQDVQILTGGFNAEYGNVRSGLINVITKDGSYNRYSGVFEGRYRPNTDKVFYPAEYDNVYGEKTEKYQLFFADRAFTGVKDQKEVYHWLNYPKNNWNYYQTWTGFNTYAATRPQSAQFFYELEQWENRPIPYMQSGDVMLDISGGGPVPLLSNTKFFVSGYWNRSEYLMSAARPHSHEYSTSFKLTRRLSSNMVLTFSNYETFVYAINMSDRSGSGGGGTGGLPSTYVTGDDRMEFANNGYFVPVQINSQCWYNPIYDKNHTFNLKFTHTYSPATYYEVSAGVTMYDSDWDHMKQTDPEIIKYIVDSKTNKTWGFDEHPWGYSPRTYINANGWTFGRTTIIGSDIRGFSKGTHDNIMNDFNFKTNIVSQINKYNQIKAGVQVSYTHVNERDSYSVTTPGDPITARLYQWAKWKADPVQIELFVQDKLEWEGMILNFGLRGLTFFPRTKAMDIGDQNFYKYDDNGNPYWVAEAQWGNVEGGGNWMWQNFRTREVKPRLYLQPRFGISHPITESSKIFFNYGHFFTSPHFNQLYSVQSVQTLGGLFGSSGQIPLPDLIWPKVVSYEIGYSQSIYNQFLLQISGYYKDYTDDITSLIFTNYTGDVYTTTFDNNRYRDVRGLEFRLERSFGRFINGWANYNYMITSTGSTGYEYDYQDPTKTQQQYFTSAQTKPEATPNFRINISLRTPVGFGPGPSLLGVKPFEEWRFNVLYTWQARARYLTNSSSAPKDWIYVERIPVQMINFYLTKRLAKGAQFYLNVQNIFNIRRLFSEGGSYRDSLHLWYETGDQHGNDRIGDRPGYAYLGTPKWRWYYPTARDIYFGVRYQF
jgi:hypothetical protein